MKLFSSDSLSCRLALSTHLLQDLQPSRLVPMLTAGLITGVLLVIYAISMAALIFTGPLVEFVPIGIGLSLFTAIIAGVTVALTNSMPGIVSMPQDSTAIILAMMASAIAVQLPASDPALLPTVIMGLAIATGSVGIVYFLLGSFSLGNLIRFIPYPVVGGFLAGTGYLLAQGAFNVMTDQFFNLAALPALLTPTMLVRWLPGCAIGLALVVLLRCYNSVFILPGIIVGSTLAFYLALWLTQTSLTTAENMGLIFGAFPEGGLWRPLHWSMLTQVNWGLVVGQIDKIATVVLLSVIALLLNVSGIELATRQDIDLNQELQSAGIANIIVGLGGGIIGFHALGLSVLSCAKIKAKSRLVGILAAIICLITLLLGETLVTLFPKLMLGGIALFLGLSFLVEWVYDAWFKLPKTDYGIVILILFVIATVGFLQGVAVGLVVAIILFVINYSRIDVSKYTLSGQDYQSHVKRPVTQERLLHAQGEQIYILSLQGLIFFGTANKLLKQVRERIVNPHLASLKFIILDFRLANGLDSSAVLSFVKLKQLAQREQIHLVFTQLTPELRRQLQQGGALEPDAPNQPTVLADLDQGMEWCEGVILAASQFRRQRKLPMSMHLKTLLADVATNAQVSTLMAVLVESHYAADKVLFNPGDLPESLYFIESGQVSLWQTTHGQRTRRLQSLRPGTILGEHTFFSQSPQEAVAIADEASKVYQLTRSNWQQLKAEHPTTAAMFSEFMNTLLAERLSRVQKEVALLLQ